MENKLTIAIVDVDSLLYYSVHPNKILDDSGNPIKILSEAGNMVFQYIDKTEDEVISSCKYMITEVLMNSKAKEYVGFVAGKNTTKNKSEINSGYKANRVAERPKLLGFAKQYFLDNYNIFEVDDIEVDDAVNIYRLNTPDSFICCIDSDLHSLEGAHFNWKKKEWITTSKQDADYIFWKNMITGTHNATKGIPGKGEKYVDNIFKSFHSNIPDYSSLVFEEFKRHFGIDEGIKQFYSNYVCTKILEKSDNFDITKYTTKPVMSIFN